MNRFLKKTLWFLFVVVMSAQIGTAQNNKEVVWTKIEGEDQLQLIREDGREYILRTPLSTLQNVGQNAIQANFQQTSSNQFRSYNLYESDDVIRQRITTMYSGMSMSYNSQVRREIERLLANPEHLETALGRSKYFVPIADSILTYHSSVPHVIKYLPLIESNYKPVIRSRAGASGIWQFMRGTARMYGLKITNSEDHRLDPIKSTEAAFTYLTDLHALYNDWNLALAAYNCGPGRVNRAIRNANVDNPSFWDIQDYLPRETSRYVPKFIAAVYVMTHSDQIGLMPDWNEYQKIQNQMSSMKKTRFDNQAASSIQASSYSVVPEQSSELTYTVKPGDNIGTIADWYDVSTKQLRAWNGITGSLIYPGQKLHVYVPNARAYIYADVDRLSDNKNNIPNNSNAPKAQAIASNSTRTFVNYKIRSGDTLWDISRRNGVSVDDIKQLNKNINSRNLRPGMIIKIREKS